ncbi:hypothetical protein BB561_000617 [Smittium simulii]|uniref:OPT superfamily oligopeptide transporter n=1 Tax=Smittium simulii TaxID=133385 RepID=A0A2T9YY83_9FUNG|nr:hypothetical protein BB561_000617 [Smittium simulii]
MYFGLQTGWISMMSLQATLVGFAVFKTLEPILKTRFSVQENVLMQTTSVAAATMPLAGGFVSILPAFSMLDESETNGHKLLNIQIYDLCLWGFGLSLFGVFFAILLRNQVIVREKLRFPSGTATAQMISVLHNRKDLEIDIANQIQSESSSDPDNNPQPTLPLLSSSRNSSFIHETNFNDTTDSVPSENTTSPDDWFYKIVLLSVSFFLSTAYTILIHFYPKFKSLPIFGRYLSDVWLWNLFPSLSFAGQGIIMGLPTTSHMLLGAIVGWGVLSPLAKLKGWAPGDVSDWKNGSRGWILWISLAIMIVDSIASLSILIFDEIYSLYKDTNSFTFLVGSPHSRPSSNFSFESNGKNPIKDVPLSVGWVGLAISALICAIIMQHLFGISLLMTLIAVILACFLAILSVRALGKTDLNPVSGIGKISQIIFGYLMPKNIVGNLVAGAIAEAGAMQAGDLMQDLKTGYLVKASTRAQFYAQFIGSIFSVFVSAYAYKLYTSMYQIPGPVFSAPTSQVWLDMARLVNGHALPDNVEAFSYAFATIFASIVLLQKIFASNLHPWLTNFSGMAFAIGIYNTPNYTLARFFGALIVQIIISLYFKYYYLSPNLHTISPQIPANDSHRKSTKRAITTYAIIAASGFVLGEGATAFVLLLIQSFK